MAARGPAVFFGERTSVLIVSRLFCLLVRGAWSASSATTPLDDARDRALTSTLCRITCSFGPMHPAVTRMAGELVAP